MKRLAYVVSSHGFGHAARTCATIEAMWGLEPDVGVTIFGRTPVWFFHQSLGMPGDRGRYDLVEVDTDVGLVQTTALREDADATARRLRARLPFDAASAELADAISSSDAEAVVCDISPWGLAAAHQLGLPSLLVENFTWDWIYDGYPELADFVEPFRRAFELATRHAQTEPVCRPAGRNARGAAHATPPVSRASRTEPSATREALGFGPEDQVVMMTMGGVAWSYEHLGALEDLHDGESNQFWIVAGGARGTDRGSELERVGRHVLLPHRLPLYHPDLVAASDVVVGKLGYSTVAEVAAAGSRFLYVPRPHFPESDRLEAWVRRHLTTQRVEPEQLEAADWVPIVSRAVADLLQRPKLDALPNGACRVAEQVLSL